MELGIRESLPYDLCIVGAGMFGSAAARHASADPCRRVCLIGPSEPTVEEMRTRTVFGAHYDEGRMVQVMEERHPLSLFAKHTINRFREIQRLSGIQFYSPTGVLLAGPKDEELMSNTLQSLRLHKMPFVDLSDGDIFKRRFPYINFDDNDIKIFDDNGSGYVSGRKLVEAQNEVASAQGCSFIEGVVDGISKHVMADIKGVKRIIKVRIQGQDPVFAKRVLFCTGAFTEFKDFQLIPEKTFNLILYKESVLLLKVSKAESERLSSMPPIMYSTNNVKTEDLPLFASGAYILPPIMYPDGKHYLKAGILGQADNCLVRTLKEAGEWYNSSGDPAVLNPLQSLLHKLLPGLQVEEIGSSTCVTTFTSSGLPYIERVDSCVTVALAGNGTGVAICDEVGRVAAELSLTGKWTSEMPEDMFKVP